MICIPDIGIQIIFVQKQFCFWAMAWNPTLNFNQKLDICCLVTRPLKFLTDSHSDDSRIWAPGIQMLIVIVVQSDNIN